MSSVEVCLVGVERVRDSNSNGDLRETNSGCGWLQRKKCSGGWWVSPTSEYYYCTLAGVVIVVCPFSLAPRMFRNTMRDGGRVEEGRVEGEEVAEEKKQSMPSVEVEVGWREVSEVSVVWKKPLVWTDRTGSLIALWLVRSLPPSLSPSTPPPSPLLSVYSSPLPRLALPCPPAHSCPISPSTLCPILTRAISLLPFGPSLCAIADLLSGAFPLNPNSNLHLLALFSRPFFLSAISSRASPTCRQCSPRSACLLALCISS